MTVDDGDVGTKRKWGDSGEECLEDSREESGSIAYGELWAEQSGTHSVDTWRGGK